MSITSILTQVQTTKSGLARLRFAAALAKKHSAELIGVGVQAFTPYVTSAGAFGYVDGASIQAVRDEIDKEVEAAHQAFVSVVSEFGILGDWRAAVDDPAEVVSRLSRSADLVVVTRHETSAAPGATAFASDILMQCGRPVLVIPPEPTDLAGQHAIVGWKDSREARRVLTDALPVLSEFEKVTVLEICASDDSADATLRTEAVAKFLSGHGIKSDAKVATRASGRVSAQILRIAADIDAELVVIGAYAHPRLREWVFGGVTQDLLEGASVPCLMSH
jgi:nucleotide-binding universal stress UspA family protein